MGVGLKEELQGVFDIRAYEDLVIKAVQLHPRKARGREQGTDVVGIGQGEWATGLIRMGSGATEQRHERVSWHLGPGISLLGPCAGKCDAAPGARAPRRWA